MQMIRSKARWVMMIGLLMGVLSVSGCDDDCVKDCPTPPQPSPGPSPNP